MAFGLRGAVVRPRPDGAYDVRMRHGERDLLGHLLGQLRELLTAGSGGGAAGADVDPVLRRLFPTAYPDDAELDAEYQGLVRDDLLERRLAAIDVVEETVDADVITEEQLLAWMGAVNDLRLVIGTRLDVSEDQDEIDPDDPDAPLWGAYAYLAWLLESIVAALADG